MKAMNGQVIKGTPICVDYWNWTPKKKYKHFLSHLHADHTYKLCCTFRENIYTSPFNAMIATKWLDVDPDLMVILEVGHPHIIYHEYNQEFFTVTLIDANHCPGSVMFLFQGNFGTILYTGDFRYSPSMLKNTMLKSLIETEIINRLYLDNTFAAEHCEFPPRKEALQEVLTLIRNHPDHYIVIGLRRLGKEEVLLEVALDLKEKILVSEERLHILEFLQYKNVFTTDPSQSRILAKNMHQINSSYIQKLKEEKGPVLTILLTALYSVLPPGEKYSKLQEDKELGIHRIPYSDHSCHSELAEFVSKVKPDTIHPIVKLPSPNEQKPTEIHNDSLNFISSSSIWRNSIIPQSILQLCKHHQGCVERNKEVSSCFVNKATVNEEIIPSQLTEDESRSIMSGPSQQVSQVHANNSKKDVDNLKVPVDSTNLIESNELEQCDEVSVSPSEEWFSLTDIDLPQKNTVENSLTLPKRICSWGKENLTNEVHLENVPELRPTPSPIFTCEMTDDEKINHQQVILNCSSELNVITPDEELSQFEYNSENLIFQPIQQSELDARESTNNKTNENNSTVEACEESEIDYNCNLQSLPNGKARISTPNPEYFEESIEKLTQKEIFSLFLSPTSDKEKDTGNDQNHFTEECSENKVLFSLEELSPHTKALFFSPDFIDLSMISNSKHINYSNITAIDQPKEVITRATRKDSEHLLLSTYHSGEETVSLKKSPLTSKPICVLESINEEEESVMSDNNSPSLLSEFIPSSPKCKLNDKINKYGQIKKTNKTLTFNSKKKLQFSEGSRRHLVKSQYDLSSDSFCKAAANSRSKFRQSATSVNDDSLTGKKSLQAIDTNDVFYRNIHSAVSVWKESVERKYSGSSLNVNLGNSDIHNQH